MNPNGAYGAIHNGVTPFPGVLAALDRDVTVVGDVLPRAVAGEVVRVRLERLRRGATEGERRGYREEAGEDERPGTAA